MATLAGICTQWHIVTPVALVHFNVAFLWLQFYTIKYDDESEPCHEKKQETRIRGAIFSSIECGTGL